MVGLKLWKIFLTSILTFVLGAQKNLPIIVLSKIDENRCKQMLMSLP